MTHAQIIAAATGAALTAHRKFGIDLRKRVEIFDVLRRADTEVFFRPLNKICGAYIPSEGGVPGVLINSNLPLSRQRYTAAHEFGHLFLGHKVASVDDILERTTIEERGTWSVEESIAEAFAAFFLMPTPLIESSLRELHVSGELTPNAIYLISLKMGTSYHATVNHLYTLKKISFAQVKTFRDEQPKDIKRNISDRAVGRHDVWIVDEHWNGQPIFPAVEDTVVLRLPEFPTSGYAWVWEKNPEALRIVEDGFADQASDEVGGSRVREFIAEVASTAGVEQISLARRQPWDSESTPSSHFTLDLFPQQTKKTGPLNLPSLRRAG
jgi:Zn-dependent peptidase ImmA (M78 family)